jgi:glycosyltransferase involved in cell wall biosynthesis
VYDEQHLISIIVPIYNVEPYLKQCVESLLVQTYPQIEIILVDDGSTDECAAICDFYEERDSRVQVIHKTNGGLVSARKVGLAASKGEYIGYVDGDDWVEPEMYMTLYQAAMETNADIIVSGYKRDFLGSMTPIHDSVPSGNYMEGERAEVIYPRMLYNGTFFKHGISTYVWNKLFRRDVLFSNQMRVDDRIFVGEDAACTYPTLLDAKSICVLESELYNYRQRANSMLKNRGGIQAEYANLHLLYFYLKSRFMESEHAQILLPQLDFFLLSLVMVRSGGLLKPNGSPGFIFPFSNVLPSSKVVVYSSGTFGQHLYNRLKSTHFCEIVSWIDDDYEQSQAVGLPVYPPNSILEMDYDFVLIASMDKTVTEEVIRTLIDIGVPPSKLSEFEFEFSEVPALLRTLGF